MKFSVINLLSSGLVLLTQQTKEIEGGWFSGGGGGEVADRMVRFQHNQNERILGTKKILKIT